MGTSLTGTKIRDTYDALLKVSDNGALDGTLQTITDGLGNNSALSLSTAGASVGGTLAVSGNAAFDTNTLFVDAANNRVGVGTSSPNSSYGLTIEDNSSLTESSTSFQGDLLIQRENTSGGNQNVGISFNVTGYKGSTSGDAYIRAIQQGNASSADITFGTIHTGTRAERMRINSDGDISFRDSSANEAFYWDASAANLGIGGFPATTYGFVRTLEVQGTSDAEIQISQTANGKDWSLGVTNGANYQQTTTGQAYVWESGGTERMRIDSSGNVGIGVSPSYQLDLGGGTTNNQRIKLHRGSDDPAQYSLLGFAEMDLRRTNVSLSAAQTSYTIKQTGSDGSRDVLLITSGGYLKASNNGSYASSTGSYHELVSNAADQTLYLLNLNLAADGLLLNLNTDGTTHYFFRGYSNSAGADKILIYTNGNVVNANNSYGAISDAKLKENVVDASPKLEDLMQVKVRNFNYIGDDKKQLGVVAQELEEVFPSMIDESPDFEEREVEVRDEEGNIVYKTEQVLVSEAVLDEEGNVIEEAVYETIVTDEPEMTKEKVDLGTVTKSVKYSVFVPMLIKAIQELNAKVESLEAQLNA